MQKAHLALIDALMTLVAKEAVGRVKMAVEAEQMGVGAPWENALLFWVNRVRTQNQFGEVHCGLPSFILMQKYSTSLVASACCSFSL